MVLILARKTALASLATLIGIGGLSTFTPALLAQTAPGAPTGGQIVPAPANPSANPSTNQIPAFTFTDLLGYSDCVEVILRLYEGKEPVTPRQQQTQCYSAIRQAYGDRLSYTDARSLISAANYYATSLTGSRLYPPRGQRVRVARDLQFGYDIDANDAQIRQLLGE